MYHDINGSECAGAAFPCAGDESRLWLSPAAPAFLAALPVAGTRQELALSGRPARCCAHAPVWGTQSDIDKGLIGLATMVKLVAGQCASWIEAGWEARETMRIAVAIAL
eukprot:9007367-Alexandrium_andersonii.AAC.1